MVGLTIILSPIMNACICVFRTVYLVMAKREGIDFDAFRIYYDINIDK